MNMIKLKGNGALKPDCLLKLWKRKTKNSAHVAKNGDTGEKRKPYRRNPVIWMQCFHNIERQNAHTQCFVVVAFLFCFFIIRVHFFDPKYISLLVPLETVCTKGICNLDLSIKF